MPRLIIDLAEEAEIIGGIEANCRFCIVDGSQTKHEFEVELVTKDKYFQNNGKRAVRSSVVHKSCLKIWSNFAFFRTR